MPLSAIGGGYYWGFSALLAWGIADYLARRAAGRLGSVPVTLLTQLAGLPLPLALVLTETAGFHHSAAPGIDWPALALWAPAAGAVLGIGYLVYYTGLMRGAVSVVSSAASAWLAVTTLIAVAFFGETLTWGQAALIAAVLAGILLLTAGRRRPTARPSDCESDQDYDRARPGDGLPWGLAAMLSIGIAMALLDRATASAGPMLAALAVRAASALPTCAFARLRRIPVAIPPTRRDRALLLAVGLLDAAGYVAYSLGVAAAPVSLVAPVAAAHPVATIALAIILERERPSPMHWAGAATTIAATIALSARAGI